METTLCTSQAKRNVSAQALNDSSTLASAQSAGLKSAAGNLQRNYRARFTRIIGVVD